MKIVWGRSIGWNIDYNKARMGWQWSSGGLVPGHKYMEYTVIEDGAGCYPWQKCFAWWPVKTITGQRAWGIKLYKRRVWVMWGTGFHMEPEVQYATLFEILNNA